jgi:hypothetical protein
MQIREVRTTSSINVVSNVVRQKMKLTDIDGLIHNKLAIDESSEPPYVDFESSEQGLWISFERDSSFSHHLKSVINLALYLGFNWENLSVSKHSDNKLTKWTANLVDDSEIDSVFNEALEYLDELAYETDPGWCILFSPEGLVMESIWTDDSDIWDEDREPKALPPKVSASAWREYVASKK